MLEYFILVRSVTYAVKVKHLLSSAGLKSNCIKSPKVLSSEGCGHAVIVHAPEAGMLFDLINKAGMPRFRIFIQAGNISFKEVLCPL